MERRNSEGNFCGSDCGLAGQPSFLDSDFIAHHELPPLLNAAKMDGLVIIWICVSPCLYEETEIREYQPRMTSLTRLTV